MNYGIMVMDKIGISFKSNYRRSYIKPLLSQLNPKGIYEYEFRWHRLLWRLYGTCKSQLWTSQYSLKISFPWQPKLPRYWHKNEWNLTNIGYKTYQNSKEVCSVSWLGSWGDTVLLILIQNAWACDTDIRIIISVEAAKTSKIWKLLSTCSTFVQYYI